MMMHLRNMWNMIISIIGIIIIRIGIGSNAMAIIIILRTIGRLMTMIDIERVIVQFIVNDFDFICRR